MKKNILTGGLSLMTILGSFASENTNKPNIIVILVDDLGYGDLSCQNFSKDIKTPNIDKLLNQGIRFTNFYANSTVSSPSRAALLTGKYPDMVGVPGVIRPNPNDSWGYLSEDVALLPEILKKHNYSTSIIGKWHLGSENPNIPNKRGFDFFHGFLSGMMDDYYTHLRDGKNSMRKNYEDINPTGHATDLFTDWAIDHIKDEVRNENPFFMYLAYNAPHDPVQPPSEWLDIVLKREKNITPKRAKLVALIEHLDYNIGRLLAYLESSGTIDNTVIFFASDNGGKLSEGASNGNLRGGKEDLYEGGIKVPAGIYWKNKIKPAVNSNFVMLFDWFPTICDLAGIESELKIDALSILPILNGVDQITDKRTVFWMRREGGLKYGGHIYYAARNGDFKLLQNTPWESRQIFNIKEDELEQNPLEKSGKIYNDLVNKLSFHITRTGHVKWQK